MEMLLELLWRTLLWRLALSSILLHSVSVRSSISVVEISSHHIKAESPYQKDNNSSVRHLRRNIKNSNPEYCLETSRTFDVLSFGAKGDGVSDDTKAFQAAWQQACEAGSSVLSAPSGYTFLVGQILFSGPCRSGITFQVGGTIAAPTDFSYWRQSKNLLQWIEFAKLHDIVLEGAPSTSGLIDGRGAAWWAAIQNSRQSDYAELGLSLSTFSIKPTAVRFYGSINVTVQDIAIENSPQTHLKFDSCWNVSVSNVYISAPPSSPNTDGIHLQDSKFVAIQSSSLRTGDDCVSIQTGSENVMISGITCGPGHGISIGGLGMGGSKACVFNISVSDSFIHHSQNGVRIKTWQGGSGSVEHVSFHNISVSNVTNPIIIDQFYCDKTSCPNKTSAISITNISYQSIRGTYFATSSAVHFACSDSIPCRGIVVDDIHLLTQPSHGQVNPVFCWNSYGQIYSNTTPNISCLQAGDPKSDHQIGYYDTCH